MKIDDIIHADVLASALAMYDKHPREWKGHTVKIKDADGREIFKLVDYVTNNGNGTYRLHLTLTADKIDDPVIY